MAFLLFENVFYNVAVVNGTYIRVFNFHKERDQIELCTENIIKNEAKLESKNMSESRLTCACFSDCGTLLAAMDGEKHLFLWKFSENTWTFVSMREHFKNCTSVKFLHANDGILCADRSGDVYLYSVVNPQSSGVLLFGHVSMLLDMVITKDDKYIITADRNEKIRVSCYPDTYNIQSFCLGHTEFVSCLVLLSNNKVLLSGSGDGTLRAWNFLEGKEIGCKDIVQDLKSEIEGNEEITAILYSPVHEVVSVFLKHTLESLIYNLNITDTNVEFQLQQSIQFESTVFDACFDLKGRLLLYLSSKKNSLQLYQPEKIGKLINFKPINEGHECWEFLNNINMQCDFSNNSFKPAYNMDKQWEAFVFCLRKRQYELEKQELSLKAVKRK